ncbi:MAG: tryptophan-rich sensory protein [Clostridia bacterium]|nr:tryptophan-rich sensory protein [Clostridia bacterium]
MNKTNGAHINIPRVIILKIQWKKLLLCIAVPLAVGGLSALLTRNSMETFDAVAKPPLSPPGWLFPVVWTILYILMGVASYLVLTSGKPNKTALQIYGVQLAFNFFWSIIFFNWERYLFAFVWLVLLWLLILATIWLFRQASKIAGYLLLPYLLWVTFAGYLNLGIFLLNR